MHHPSHLSVPPSSPSVFIFTACPHRTAFIETSLIPQPYSYICLTASAPLLSATLFFIFAFVLTAFFSKCPARPPRSLPSRRHPLLSLSLALRSLPLHPSKRRYAVPVQTPRKLVTNVSSSMVKKPVNPSLRPTSFVSVQRVSMSRAIFFCIYTPPAFPMSIASPLSRIPRHSFSNYLSSFKIHSQKKKRNPLVTTASHTQLCLPPISILSPTGYPALSSPLIRSSFSFLDQIFFLIRVFPFCCYPLFIHLLHLARCCRRRRATIPPSLRRTNVDRRKFSC